MTVVFVKPGTIGFTSPRGVVGAFLGLGQLILGDGSRYAHVFVVVDAGMIVEAQPSGAVLAPLSKYLDGRPLAFGHAIPLTDDERSRISDEACALVGTPYSFLDYVSLGLVRLGVHWGPVERRVARGDRLICSALADLAYARAGVHLFDDGRLPHQVTPGDLANLLIERDWSAWRPA